MDDERATGRISRETVDLGGLPEGKRAVADEAQARQLKNRDGRRVARGDDEVRGRAGRARRDVGEGAMARSRASSLEDTQKDQRGAVRPPLEHQDDVAPMLCRRPRHKHGPRHWVGRDVSRKLYGRKGLWVAALGAVSERNRADAVVRVRDTNNNVLAGRGLGVGGWEGSATGAEEYGLRQGPPKRKTHVQREYNESEALPHNPRRNAPADSVRGLRFNRYDGACVALVGA